jgi:DNA repair protein SbcD/Mre11
LDQQQAITKISGVGGNTTEQDEGIVRVILTADNHLSAYSPKLSPAKLSERRRRLAMAFQQTVDTAISRRAHLFIQAGDLFDRVDPRNQEREFVAGQLLRLQSAGVKTFAVSGNHDTPRQKTEQGGYAPQTIYHRFGGMHYFSSSVRIEPVQIERAGIQLAIAGLSYPPGIAPGADPLDSVEIVDPENILTQAELGILILHTAIEGHAFPGEMETFVRQSSLVRLNDFHVVLAGHVHAYDRFHIGEQVVVACGATERMEFRHGEDTVGFVYLELIRDGLPYVEHVLITPQPRHVVTIHTTELWPNSQNDEGSELGTVFALAGEIPVNSPMEKIIQQLDPYCTEDAMVRLILEGPITREQYETLDLRTIWMYGHQRAFLFELDESNLRLKSDLMQYTIERGERIAPRDMLEAIIKERMEQTETPDDRVILTKTRQRVLDGYDELVGREAR